MAKNKTPQKSEKGDYGEEREVPQQEKDAVSKLLSDIDKAKKRNKHFEEVLLKKWRATAQGRVGTTDEDSDECKVRTNLIFATMATALPYIYAKNPEIAVELTEAVDQDNVPEYEQWKAFAETAQIMIQEVLVSEGELKKRAKANVRSTMTTGVGWLKLSWQDKLTGDPIILRRHNDIQDNLRRVEHLIECSKDEDDTKKLNVQKQELAEQKATIEQGNEVQRVRGFVIDRIKSEDILILDSNVVEFDDYPNAEKIAHRVYMSDDTYKEVFKHKVPEKATSYSPKKEGSGTGVESRPEWNEPMRAVYEVWNKKTGHVSTVCEGVEGYCRPPYQPRPVPERWYPFYALAFNIVEGRWRPMSDIELLQILQKEYDDTRFSYAEDRKDASPKRVFRKGGNLTEEDINNMMNSKRRQWTGIEGNPQVPLNQDILQLEGIRIDPAVYDTSAIRDDMDLMVGLSDASRSNLIDPKTATEAKIMENALGTRMAERQDANEEMISEMALASLQVMLDAKEGFTEQEVKELAGAGAVWPQLGAEDIFRKIRVKVRAGSTVRPNQQKEREQWMELLPLVNGMVDQIAQLQMQGAVELVETKKKLMEETFRRFDERLDIEAFVGRPQPGMEGEEQMMNPQIMQLQQALQQAQAQIQQLTQGQDLEREKMAMQERVEDKKIKVSERAEMAKVIADAKSKGVDYVPGAELTGDIPAMLQGIMGALENLASAIAMLAQPKTKHVGMTKLPDGTYIVQQAVIEQPQPPGPETLQ